MLHKVRIWMGLAYGAVVVSARIVTKISRHQCSEILEIICRSLNDYGIRSEIMYRPSIRT